MADTVYPAYQMLKGLQRPLEFMGLRGRYIFWGALTAGGALIGFIAAYLCAGFLPGLVALFLALAAGGLTIMVKQMKGLHSKKEDKGVFVFARFREARLKP